MDIQRSGRSLEKRRAMFANVALAPRPDNVICHEHTRARRFCVVVDDDIAPAVTSRFEPGATLQPHAPDLERVAFG